MSSIFSKDLILILFIFLLLFVKWVFLSLCNPFCFCIFLFSFSLQNRWQKSHLIVRLDIPVHNISQIRLLFIRIYSGKLLCLLFVCYLLIYRWQLLRLELHFWNSVIDMPLILIASSLTVRMVYWCFWLHIGLWKVWWRAFLWALWHSHWPSMLWN